MDSSCFNSSHRDDTDGMFDPFSDAHDSSHLRDSDTDERRSIGQDRPTLIAMDEREVSGDEAGTRELPVGVVTGKRKHSEVFGEACLEPRLTARCRSFAQDGGM